MTGNSADLQKRRRSSSVLNSQYPRWGILHELSALNLKQNFISINQVVWVFWSDLPQNCLTLWTVSVKIMLSLASCVIPVALLLVCPAVEVPYSLTSNWYFYLKCYLNLPSSHRTLEDFIINESWLCQNRKQNRKQLVMCTVPLAGWQVKRNRLRTSAVLHPSDCAEAWIHGRIHRQGINHH